MESIHNWEAIKQLVIKIVQVIGGMIGEEAPGPKRKEEKKKELEEYFKVMANILQLDKKARETLVASLHK
jgi:hypothetical protein